MAPGDLAHPKWNAAIAGGVWLALLLTILATAPELQTYLESSDMGYQLSLGQQVLAGKTPGVNLLMFYGPLVAYTSALGLWLGGSLIGEVVICALGYSLALWLMWLIVARHGNRLAATAAAASGYLLLARFYKWYLWLLPLLVLWELDGYLRSPAARRGKWPPAIGLTLGIGWLYRFDIAAGLTAAAALMIGLVELRSAPDDWRRAGRSLAAFDAACTLPLLVWLGVLYWIGGPHAMGDYLSMTWCGAVGVVRGLSSPLPEFILSSPFHKQNLILAAYVLGPLTYALCLLRGIRAEIGHRATPTSRILLAIALVGVCISHQAMHRRDAAHLLQVIPPAILGMVLLGAIWLRRRDDFGQNATSARRTRIAGVCYVTVACAVGSGLVTWGRLDLGPASLWPSARYRALAAPLAPGHTHPVAAALREVQRCVPPDQSILVFPAECQYYAIAQRRMSGLLNTYFPSLYCDSPWRERNLDAICRDAPKLVIVPDHFLDPQKPYYEVWARGIKEHQAVEQWIRRNYTKVVYDHDGIVLLEKP